jgi:trans-AT polyketide synthase, acyltransferase and oxidoreductase domains
MSLMQGPSPATGLPGAPSRFAADALERAIGDCQRSFRVDVETGQIGAAGSHTVDVPAFRLENLGSREFCADHRLRYPYFAGAMANGIGSVELVEALSRAGLLGFFGAAGLAPKVVDGAIERLTRALPDTVYGFNLIHSPNEPTIENDVAELYIRRGVKLVEASAYLGLTLPLVRYRVHGIHKGPDGRVVTPNRVIAKVSRVEVASKFFAPPPAEMLRELVAAGRITAQQAELAGRIPMAQDVTAEADSAGHTDNRPAITLLPTLLSLRDRFQQQYGYATPLRVGLAGGIATPASAAAAFAMGAAYIVTGSINQACVESGSSELVRQMLAEAEQADTIMAPAADMFEMGVKVQVLRRGTMFAMRGAKLFELYRTCSSLDNIPPADRALLEKTVFRASLDEIWSQTRAFFLERDPRQISRAEQDAKHKMALVFRWYLGQSSRWANRGEASRKIDYQVWCGPAMGAFNEWTRGSFLERPENRRVVTVAMNILYGAAVVLRAASLRFQGVPLPADCPRVGPLELNDILHRLDSGR